MHNCNQNALCQNNIGSFSCVCNTGYIGIGTKCSGRKKSFSPNHDVGTVTFMYFCLSIMIADANECILNTTNNCSNNSICTNTLGSFSCACKTGYTGSGVQCTGSYSSFDTFFYISTSYIYLIILNFRQ